MPNMKTFSRKKVKTHGKRHGKTSMKKYGKTVKTSKARRLRKKGGGDGDNNTVVIIENTKGPGNQPEVVSITKPGKQPEVVSITKPGKQPEVLSITKPENIAEYEEIKKNMADIVEKIEQKQYNDGIDKIQEMISKISDKITQKKPEEINDACNEVHGDACKNKLKSSSIFSSIFGQRRTVEQSTTAIHDCNAEIDCKLDNIIIYYVYGEAIFQYVNNANIDQNVHENLKILLKKIEDYKNVYLAAIKESSRNTSVMNISGIATRYFETYDAKEFLQGEKKELEQNI
jgi:chaperonin cofactor prefoldin